MIKVSEFKAWMDSHTEFSDKVKSDVVSRLKRADAILPWTSDETYIFFLGKKSEFNSLSISVKSQIRRSLKLYRSFWSDTNQTI